MALCGADVVNTTSCDYAYVIPRRTLISSALGVLTKWLKFSAIMDELFSKSVKAIPLDKPTALL